VCEVGKASSLCSVRPLSGCLQGQSMMGAKTVRNSP
jgi:hypothetical protein